MFGASHAFSSFSVDDLAAAKAFYAEKLGLAVHEIPEGLELRLEGGGVVFLYSKPNHAPADFTVLNFPVDDIGAAVNELTAKGVKMEHYDNMHQDEQGIARTPKGQPGPVGIAWFKDPAGNVLSVLQEQLGR